MSRRETSAEIDDAAAQWAMRLDEAGPRETEQTEFEQWLEGDIRRVGAFARAQAVLVHVRRARALGTNFEPSRFEGVPGEAVAPDSLEAPAAPFLTRRRMLMGVSAVAATGAFAVLLPTQRAAAVVYETGRGEVRLVPLSDGSTVTLNTDSRIAVTIDDTHRHVQLVHGEALFKVATAKRPAFTVETGEMSVRAQSATFAVCRLKAGAPEVKVCDGNVDVAKSSFLGRNTRHLGANMRAVIKPDGVMIDGKVAAGTLERELAWQEGMLSFEDTPLSQAVAQFARYSDRHIRIADPAVAAETVTGLYAANNPEGFAQAVALGLNLHMQKTAGNIILTR